jgi:hypothetical protein
VNPGEIKLCFGSFRTCRRKSPSPVEAGYQGRCSSRRVDPAVLRVDHGHRWSDRGWSGGEADAVKNLLHGFRRVDCRQNSHRRAAAWATQCIYCKHSRKQFGPRQPSLSKCRINIFTCGIVRVLVQVLRSRRHDRIAARQLAAGARIPW